eukprot:1074569-Amorphochlora_amoeboformis.AAC.2
MAPRLRPARRAVGPSARRSACSALFPILSLMCMSLSIQIGFHGDREASFLGGAPAGMYTYDIDQSNTIPPPRPMHPKDSADVDAINPSNGPAQAFPKYASLLCC